MANGVWDSKTSLEMESVHTLEIRYLSRFVSCLVAAVAVLVLSLTGTAPRAVGIISACFCVFLYVMCFTEINRGFADAFGKGATEATFRSVSLAVACLHSLWMIFFESDSSFSYVWVVALSLSVSYLIMFLWEHEIRENIHLLERGQLCGAETAPSDLKRRKVLNLCMLRPLDYAPEIAYASRNGNPFRFRTKRFVPTCLAVSLIGAVIAALLGDFSLFVPTFTASVCLCAGFTGEIASRLPYIMSQKKIRGYGGVMLGYSSVSRLCECNTFVVKDTDFFPKGTVRIADIRFRADCDVSSAIEYLAALLREAHASSADAVLGMISFNPALLPQVSELQLLPGEGIRGVIDGHTVMAGGRNLMLAHNIAPLEQSREAAIRSSTKSLTYLAVDGKLAAMVLFQYKPEPELKQVLHDLKSDIAVVIDTVDYNITENLVRKAYRLDSLRVMIPDIDERRFLARLSRRLDERSPKPALITCKKNTAVFFGTDRAGDIYTRIMQSLTVRRVGVIVGLAITLAASFFVPSLLSPFWVFGMQCIWALPLLALSPDR